jgi:hypothetical protein
MGFTYDELENAIGIIEKNYVCLNGKRFDISKKVELLHRFTEHKRIIPKEYERI